MPGLLDGSFGFGGEESAGASFLRRDGSTWTTDKDGILLALLASEIQATTGRSPSEHYADLVAQHGEPAYARVDAPADRDQKAKLAALKPDDVSATELAGEPILDKLTEAPGNGAKIGGLKVTTESAWFAARPSGTEDVYKIYAESFKGPDHLAEVQAEAREVVSAALTAGTTSASVSKPRRPSSASWCRASAWWIACSWCVRSSTDRLGFRDARSSLLNHRGGSQPPMTGVVRSTIDFRSVPTGRVPRVPL